MAEKDSSPPKPASRETGRDVIIAAGPTADKEGAVVLRARADHVEVGELRPVVEGKPLQGELVVLSPRAGTQHVFDVKDSYDPRGGTGPEAKAPVPEAIPVSSRKGGRPPQVATRSYRENWEAIYGAATKGDPNLN